MLKKIQGLISLFTQNNDYQTFISYLNNKTESECILYLQTLDSEKCNQLALIQNEKKRNLVDVLIDAKKNTLLSQFIDRLTEETCEKLCWPIPEEGGTFNFIASNPNFHMFTLKLKKRIFKLSAAHSAKGILHLLAAHTSPHRNVDNVCALQIIAENQPPRIFEWFLNDLFDSMCHRILPTFFNALDVKYLSLENFKLFLNKTRNHIYTSGNSIQEYVTSHTNASKKFLTYLSHHHAYFIALLDHLTLTSLEYILDYIKLSPESLASISLSKEFPHLFLRNKKIGLKILATAREYPKTLKALQAHITQLQSIQFFDGGNSVDVWSGISKSLFSHAPPIKPHLNRTYLTHEVIKTKKPMPNVKIHLHENTFLRIQGRTVLLQNKEGNFIAVKVKKKNENVVLLNKEYQVTDYLKQNTKKLNLKSRIPTPLGCGEVSNILGFVKEHASKNDFETFSKMIDNQVKHFAYTYEVNPKNCDYFTYLHDPYIPDEVFKKANRDIVHDLFILLQKGLVFPQLADIFHNNESGHAQRYDNGRYIVLINLLNVNAKGGGRLTGWKKAVQYPNLRVSGLADLGDSTSLHTLIHAYKHYAFISNTFGARAGNYILANLIAEYQYVLFLIAGCRAAGLTKIATEQKKPQAEINNIWQTMAIQILENCVQATSILTQHSEEKIKEYLTSKIDVARLGRQMRYWMTGDYINNLSHNIIRKDIYEKETSITVEAYYFRSGTFHANLGFSLNGVDPDLGAVNGQEPIKENNHLIYQMINYIFTSHQLLNETLRDLTKIIKEKDIARSEKLRKESFSFLPDIALENIQFSLGKERLKQKTLPASFKSHIIAEQKTIAASKIRRFWRSHQSVKRISTMRERSQCRV